MYYLEKGKTLDQKVPFSEDSPFIGLFSDCAGAKSGSRLKLILLHYDTVMKCEMYSGHL